MSLPVDAFTGIVHPDVRAYLGGLLPTPDPVLAALEQHALDQRFPLIGRASGQVLELLARAIGARRVFELGSGFGFSAWFFASAVGEGGEVICTDNDPRNLEAFVRLYGDHPFAARIRYLPGDALDALRAFEGTLDVVLVDIDKAGYPEALELAADKLRPGGLLLADNTLWGGKVTLPAADQDASTAALGAFNQRLFADPRFQAAILPVGDGLGVGLRL